MIVRWAPRAVASLLALAVVAAAVVGGVEIMQWRDMNTFQRLKCEDALTRRRQAEEAQNQLATHEPWQKAPAERNVAAAQSDLILGFCERVPWRWLGR